MPQTVSTKHLVNTWLPPTVTELSGFRHKAIKLHIVLQISLPACIRSFMYSLCYTLSSAHVHICTYTCRTAIIITLYRYMFHPCMCSLPFKLVIFNLSYPPPPPHPLYSECSHLFLRSCNFTPMALPLV